MPFTYAINYNYNDLTIGNDGKLAVIYGAEEVRQRILISLRHYWQEYFLNVPAGVPWYELILGSKDMKQASMLVRKAILEVPGVTSIIDLSSSFSDRNLFFDGRVEVVGQDGPSIENISFTISMGD